MWVPAGTLTWSGTLINFRKSFPRHAYSLRYVYLIVESIGEPFLIFSFWSFLQVKNGSGSRQKKTFQKKNSPVGSRFWVGRLPEFAICRYLRHALYIWVVEFVNFAALMTMPALRYQVSLFWSKFRRHTKYLFLEQTDKHWRQWLGNRDWQRGQML